MTALILVCLIASAGILLLSSNSIVTGSASGGEEEEEARNYIHWVDFNISYEVLDQALQYDIKSHARG